MSEFLKKYWVMSLLAFIILSVAASSIICAVARGEGDNGFMRVDSKPVVWKGTDLPISCFYSDVLHSHFHYMNDAIQRINSSTNKIVFLSCYPWSMKTEYSNSRKKVVKGIVLVTSSVEDVEGEESVVVTTNKSVPIFSSVYHKNGNIYGVRVSADPDYKPWKESVRVKIMTNLYLRAFLNALGLDNDRVKKSIMYPTGDAGTILLQKITDRDMKLLKSVYSGPK